MPRRPRAKRLGAEYPQTGWQARPPPKRLRQGSNMADPPASMPIAIPVPWESTNAALLGPAADADACGRKHPAGHGADHRCADNTRHRGLLHARPEALGRKWLEPRRPEDRHAGRPRHVDARDHQGHPRLPDPGRHLRVSERRAGGERRHLHSVCEPHRGDGSRHQSGRRDTRANRHWRAQQRADPTAGRRAEGRRSPARRRRSQARSPRSRSTMRLPIFAVSPNCAGATPSGGNRQCAKR